MYSPSVVILKADRLHADLLRQVVLSVLPNATCRVIQCLKIAREQLALAAVDLLLTGIGSFEDDVLDLIAQCTREPRRVRSTFVVTSRREPLILATLRMLSVSGVFDSSTEGSGELVSALRVIHAGKTYWSRSLIECIGRNCTARASISKLLTPTEQLAFAMIGDGCDDVTAAEKLGLKPSTILSLRGAIHRKLGLRHRGELVRLAILSGYVCFVSGSVVRPGFAMLAAACHPRATRGHRGSNSRI